MNPVEGAKQPVEPWTALLLYDEEQKSKVMTGS